MRAFLCHCFFNNCAYSKRFYSRYCTLLRVQAGADDPKLVSECADLLEKMCHLEPEKRLQVRACLEHPFMKNADKAEHNHHGQHNKAAK